MQMYFKIWLKVARFFSDVARNGVEAVEFFLSDSAFC